MNLEIHLPDDTTSEERETFLLAWRAQMSKDPASDTRSISEVFNVIAASVGMEWDHTSSVLAPRFVRRSKED